MSEIFIWIWWSSWIGFADQVENMVAISKSRRWTPTKTKPANNRVLNALRDLNSQSRYVTLVHFLSPSPSLSLSLSLWIYLLAFSQQMFVVQFNFNAIFIIIVCWLIFHSVITWKEVSTEYSTVDLIFLFPDGMEMKIKTHYLFWRMSKMRSNRQLSRLKIIVFFRPFSKRKNHRHRVFCYIFVCSICSKNAGRQLKR